MKSRFNLFSLLFTALFSLSGCEPSESEKTVYIRTTENGFELIRNGEPYFVKGARTLGTRLMDRVVQYGGNSIRIGSSEGTKETMDAAHAAGLTVLRGLPVKGERNGMDYSDSAQVKQQKEAVMAEVREFKDHPALLIWVIGNELDHIPGDKDYNLYLWNALNDLAIAIHREDPNHPVMTVIGTGRKDKLADLVERAPDIDLLGVNSYQDIYEIPDWLRQYNWNRPYLVTEWGPSGHWQVPKTSFGMAIEETSSEKATAYEERYRKVIANDPWCLGSYVFLWTANRQEHTHTWYNMFNDDGSEKEVVEVMYRVWTGKEPDNYVPRLDSLVIEGKKPAANLELTAGQSAEALVYVQDPDGDSLQYTWELLPELREFGAYAGSGEKKPEALFLESTSEPVLKFEVPEEAWKYRLFVYVTDGKDHTAVANFPFMVKSEE